MSESQGGVEAPEDFGSDARAVASRWHTEIKLAKKFRDKWLKRAKKIVRRYRDELGQAAEKNDDLPQPVRFNVLWSNTQTLLPAVYAKMPKVIVERRFLNRDPVGRCASMILERALTYNMGVGYFYKSTRKAALDYLLPGQGVVWHRYEPTYDYAGPAITDAKASTLPHEPPAAEEGGDEYAASVASEKICTDYVHCDDYLTNAARTCDELRWVGKRSYLTRDQLIERFGDNIGNAVPLDYKPKDMPLRTKPDPMDEMFSLASVWECWNKTDRKVYFISEHYEAPLEVADDPLGLECFWPTPEPLLATVANDSIVPTPDYAEYQGQAQELDDLTARIAALTKCIKVCGVYDASVPALKQMLEEAQENKLYPVANWASFAEKKGLEGAVDLLPVREMAETLIRLYEARTQVKNDLYEITGISDIVRGASAGPAKTATEQRIKGQFASLRLTDRQMAVAEFCRDSLRIQAEIMSEHFSPETLYMMSGYAEWGPDQFSGEDQPQQMQQPPQQPSGPMQPPQQMQPQPGQMNGAGQPGMMAPPPMTAEQKSMQMFQQAVQLLKSDKLRGFRIEIETDSTIEPDAQAEKQARVEFLGAVAQFMPQAIEAATAQPDMAPLMAKMLLFAVRGFRVGRELETAMEEAISKLEKAAQNPQPKPPTPEEIKVQGEQQKMQMEMQKGQMDMQNQRQSNEMDMQVKQAELQIKREELELKREELALKSQEMQIKMQFEQQKMAMQSQMDSRKMSMEGERMDMEAEHEEASMERQAEHDERKISIQEQAMKKKASQPEARP